MNYVVTKLLPKKITFLLTCYKPFVTQISRRILISNKLEYCKVNRDNFSNFNIYRPTDINKLLVGCLNCYQVRNLTLHRINSPAPETCKKNLRYVVHYPKDGKYTIEKLPMTKLGGRDPETGRLIFGCIGGGHKRKFRWIQHHRVPLDHDSHTIVERIVNIQYDPNQTAHIALVGQSDKLRFIIATTKMKKGDLILSTKELPPMPIRPKEGNAHPVGALPLGTQICCIETIPGEGTKMLINAGCNATVARRVKNKMYVRLNPLKEIVLDPHCIVVIGQVSNPENRDKHIGSAWRLRWLGRRPRSGLWQKKSGRHGRKKKVFTLMKPKVKKIETPTINLTAHGHGPRTPVIPATHRVS